LIKSFGIGGVVVGKRLVAALSVCGLSAAALVAAAPASNAGVVDNTPPVFTKSPDVKTAVGQRLPWRSTINLSRDARFVYHWTAEDPEAGVCSNSLYLDDFQHEDPLTTLPDVSDGESPVGRFVVRQQGLVGGSISSLDITGGHAVATNCSGDWVSQWTDILPELIDENGNFYDRDGSQRSWAHTVSETGTWNELSSSTAIDGAHLVTSEDGASINYEASLPSAETMGLVADLGPGMGKVEVWVNGQFVKTIDLSAATARARTVVGNVRLPWTTVVNVKLVARNSPPGQGTAGTHVALDGFVLV
jgi:hypothetical protein